MLKKIASNTIAQLVAKFFSAGLTLLTTYFLIRLAGIELYGDLTKTLVLVAVGFTAIDFGLNAEGVRSASDNKSMLRNTLNILFTRLLLSVLVVIGLNILIYLLPTSYSQNIKSIFWLGSLAIIFQGIYTSGNSWFQYNLSYWKSTFSVLGGAILNTLLTLYYLWFSPTLFHFVIAFTAGYALMALITLSLLPKLPLHSFRLINAFALLKSSLMLGLILLASVVASKIDTIILGVFRSVSEVGEYGFAYRIFDVVLVLPAFVMNVIYPLYLREKLNHSTPKIVDQTTKYLGYISLAVALIVYLLAPYMEYVRPGLALSISVLRVLALSLPFFYVTSPLMWGLVAKQRDSVVLGIYLLAVLLNFILNYSLIPSYGALAAAWNTGITELFIFIALLVAVKRYP